MPHRADTRGLLVWLRHQTGGFDRESLRWLLATGLLLLAACGGHGVNDGPLGGGGSAGGFCAQVRPGGSLAAGETFTNGGRQAALITGVTLWHSRHLRLLSAWALPVGNQGSIGAVAWPPPLSVVPNWGVRVPAVGARIPSAAHWQIVLRLAPAGSRTGSAAAVTVSYEEAGTKSVMPGGSRHKNSARSASFAA